MVLRRRRLPQDLEPAFGAFRTAVEALERGKSALTASVPGTRMPGRPLAEGLAGFEAALREAGALHAAWRVPQVEDAWRAAGSALDACAAGAARLRLEADPPDGFEGLIGVIGELMAPLEAFGSAAERFRQLRR